MYSLIKSSNRGVDNQGVAVRFQLVYNLIVDYILD